MSASKHEHLFSAGRVGPLPLKNRIVMAPMTTRQADAAGYVTDAGVAYFVARARGGVGLITVEMASPERAGKHRNFELGLYDDRFLPGLTRLVSAIHAAGAKASIQIGHGGGHTRFDIAGQTPIAPSAVPHSVQEGHTEIIVPEAMTRDRIACTTEAFAAAAVRAGKAGFDAVEIHAAHGYLISQFLAPLENVRTDEYGGSLENRARFALEVTRAVKAAVPRLAVIFRMNGDDFFAGGMTRAEAVEVAVWAAEAGADAIHVTAGHYRSQPSAAIMIPPMATGPTPFAGFAAAVSQRVRVPVISVGRYGDPAAAEAALASGTADFIALGRPLLADPDWVEKAARGQEVRRCLACNTCVDGMRTGGQLHCLVNRATGREIAFEAAKPVRTGKRIAVIGGGPAGLTYASLMAGANEVTLFERANEVGGAFRLAGHAPLFQGVAADPTSLVTYVDALGRACRDAGVTIRTGCDPATAPAQLSGFDHVVIATGADYRVGGGIVRTLLRNDMLKTGILASLARRDGFRNWFYHSARRATGAVLASRLGGAAPSVEIIGDADRPGKSDAAIASAYAAAFGPLETERTP